MPSAEMHRVLLPYGLALVAFHGGGVGVSLRGTGTGLMTTGACLGAPIIVVSRACRACRACRAIMPAGAGWVEFYALIEGSSHRLTPTHLLGCHHRRVSDRVVFEHVAAALVHGSEYERITTKRCPDRTIRQLAQGLGVALLAGSSCLVDGTPRARGWFSGCGLPPVTAGRLA